MLMATLGFGGDTRAVRENYLGWKGRGQVVVTSTHSYAPSGWRLNLDASLTDAEF